MKTIRVHLSLRSPGLALVLGLMAAGAFASDPEIPASTRRMAERLRTIAKASDPVKSMFQNAERAAMYEAASKEAGDVGSRFGALIQASLEYTNSGNPEKGLAITQDLRK